MSTAKFVAMVCLLFACVSLHAQDKSWAQIVGEAQIGGQTGLGFKPPSSEFGASIEAGKKWEEIHLGGYYSPDRKYDTNDGASYGFEFENIIWVQKHVGFFGLIRYNRLITSQFEKDGWDVSPGVSARFKTQGFYVDYLLPTGKIDPVTGIESSRLQGPEVTWLWGLGHVGRVGIESEGLFGVYHLYEQGNPQCDGTYGPVLAGCARTGHTTLTAMLGIRFVLPVK